MKLMIASDIHGSLAYCREMIGCFYKERADKLILLGDLLYHGPRNELPLEYNPKEVIGLLNGKKNCILCIRGNCDSEVDQMVLEFPILAEYGIMYINNRMIFMTHGHIHNKEKPPMLNKGDILLYGHTHIPMCEKGDYIYMNPGSISIPKEGSSNSYMIIEEDIFTWKTLKGHVFNEYILEPNTIRTSKTTL